MAQAFIIRFKVINHFNDDAGYYSGVETTIVCAEDQESALKQFTEDMDSEPFELISAETLPFSMH